MADNEDSEVGKLLLSLSTVGEMLTALGLPDRTYLPSDYSPGACSFEFRKQYIYDNRLSSHSVIIFELTNGKLLRFMAKRG